MDRCRMRIYEPKLYMSHMISIYKIKCAEKLFFGSGKKIYNKMNKLIESDVTLKWAMLYFYPRFSCARINAHCKLAIWFDFTSLVQVSIANSMETEGIIHGFSYLFFFIVQWWCTERINSFRKKINSINVHFYIFIVDRTWKPCTSTYWLILHWPMDDDKTRW